jgi:hypothetical protein
MRGWLLAVATIALPLGSRADEYHYNNVFVGARAAGTGGAMAGLADDPSAAYYNPAGLAHATHELVTLNATALLTRTLTLKGFLGSDVDQKSTASLPLASVVTSPLAGGRLAIAGMTTDHDAFRLDRRLDAPEVSHGLSEARISRDRFDQTYLAGVAYGRDVTGDFDLGLAAYYVFRTFLDHDADSRRLATPLPDGRIAFERLFARQGLSHGLMLIGGLLYHPGGADGPFRFGLVVRTGANVATAAVSDEAMFVGFRDPTLSDPTRVRFERRPQQSRTDAVVRVPPALVLGASVRPLQRLVLLCDLSLHGFVAYESLGKKVTKLATVNAAVGAELSLGSVALRAGGFTNRTSAPLPKVPTDAPADSWDQYGGTVGVTVTESHHSLIFSAKAGVMRGAASVQASETEFDVVEVSGFEIAATAGGSYHF